MKELLFVAGGGAAGAVLRHLVNVAFGPRAEGSFPLATFVVNLVGCLLLGGFLAWTEGREAIPDGLRLAVATGFLGALTTFSTFVADGRGLLVESAGPKAAAYLLLSVALGYAAFEAGRALARLAAA